MFRLLPIALLFATWSFPLQSPVSTTPQGPVRIAPRPDNWRELGVGRRLPQNALQTLEAGQNTGGGPKSLLVFALTDQGCPVSKRYVPTLSRLAAEWPDAEFRLLDVTPSQAPPGRDFPKNMRVVPDPDREIASRISARTTAEVFLLDSALTVRYRGAIDDQYGIGYSRSKPSKTYLADALRQLSKGSTVEVRATTAPGCYLEMKIEDSSEPVTYHNRISRIIRENCETCHREGGAGPFPLDTYRNVYGYASMIKFAVQREIMPPWFAQEHDGRWVNDRRLTSADRQALVSWIDSGMPEGDVGQAPLPAQWEDSWTIGRPDAVVELPEPIGIPASGVVDYKYVYVKTDFPEDRWISRMEVLPTAPQATHHVLVFIEEPGRSQERRRPGEPRFQGGLSGYFASTVPGQQAAVFPPGMAKRLPKGAWLKFQLHYTPTGEPLEDRTRLGFIFADGPPEKEIQTAAAFNTDFEIPAGDPGHKVVAEHRFRRDAVLLGFFPHMHYRGKAFKYELLHQDGRVSELLNIPRYDFNWQLNYQFASPVEVPAGAVLRATAWFDNSADNPANPDPTRPVYFGEQTFEEMMIGYFDWYAR